jgi:predicted nucleotidyltransferase
MEKAKEENQLSIEECFDENLKKSIIHLAIAGSNAYGTKTPSSDEDYRGIYIPTQKELFGFVSNKEQFEFKQPDIVVYDIRKFFNLAANCNPNILEIIFAESQDILKSTLVSELIISNRNAFLSKRAKNTYLGYAFNQLQKITKKTAGKRSEFYENFGFDTKAAMHLVRILRSGIELFSGKGIIVKRPDAEELLSIRNGSWSFEKINNFANDCKKQMIELVEKSTLPENPNMEFLNNLCIEVVEKFNSEREK